MAGIICKWLNYEVKLSKFIEYGEIGRDFSNGYLFAQIFWKYSLIDNLDDFTDFGDNESVKKNFALLQPLWDQLEIKTSPDVVSDIQKGKTTTIIEQLYKMFVNIENQKCHIKQMGASSRPMTPQADKNAAIREIEESISRSVEACWRLQDLMSTRENQLHAKLHERQEQTRKLLEERSRRIASKLKEYVQSPIDKRQEDAKKTPYVKVEDYVKTKKFENKMKEVKSTFSDLDAFENKIKAPNLYKKPHAEDVCILFKSRLEKAKALHVAKPSEYLNISDENYKWNQDYVDRIRLQLNEELRLRLARKQRKHQIVEEQLQLFQGTEREHLEEIMVELLLRQSKFEKKMINELMLIRKEKAIMLESRRLHAKQLADMREKEFADAMDLEQRRTEVDKTYKDSQTRNDWQFHKLLLTKHKEECQKKHYEICWDIVLQIVDLAVCVSHHLTLVGTKIPPRLWREWKVLFVEGKPFFSHVEDPSQLDEPWEIAIEDIQREEERLNALDEAEFQDYKNRTNDWEIPSNCEVEQIRMRRSILGHIVYTILHQVYVFPPPPRIPVFPYAPFRICILGKPFIGKTSLCEQIAFDFSPMPVKIINAQTALEDALQAYHCMEDIITSQDRETTGDLVSDYFDPHSSSSSSTVGYTVEGSNTTYSRFGSSYYSNEEETEDEEEPPRVREMTPLTVLGYLAWTALKQGKEVDDNLIVKIILEIVRQLPDGTSWILDGFPVNIQQAKFLESGLSAYYTPEDLYILHTAEEQEPSIYELRSSHLVSNPDPPEAPPPPKCSFDVSVYLDGDDAEVLKRASDHIAATEIDWDFSQLSIHKRLQTFNGDWPEIMDWFQSMNVLKILHEEPDSEETMRNTISVWLNDIITTKNKQKTSKSISASHTDVKNFILHPNDKCFQYPTPSPSTVRLHAGGGFGEHSGDPSTDSEFGGNTASTSSISPASATVTSVISSLLMSLTDIRPSQPGDANWSFVKEPIPLEMATNVAKVWQNMEMGYIEILKKCFRKIRQYQDCVIQTFYNIQEHFKQFLKRPDDKQEFVSKWQEQYNELDDDMRSDEETKAELHMRVDDLKHVLWEICDLRLQESKIELSQIATSGWLDDWLSLMSNRYVCLMQAEVDRFYDTLQIITDYYDSMEGLPMKDVSELPFGVPLLDMAYDQNASFTSVQSVSREAPKGKVIEEEDIIIDEFSDILIHRSYLSVLSTIEKKLALIYQSIGVEDDSKGKGRMKMVSDDLLSYIPPEIINAGIKQLSEPKEKLHLEYFAAVAEEECRIRTNLWLIEYVGVYKSSEFSKHSNRVYGHLEHLLEQKYQRELDAIEDLCRIMGYAIEQEKSIQEELVLHDDNFFINADIILFPTPPVEQIINAEELREEGFNITQILEFSKQFSQIAPNGFIATYRLETIFNDIIAKDDSLELIPEDWLNLKPVQIHKLMDYVAGGQEFVNWRLFLLYLTKPWPHPSEMQLIETLDRFHSIDTDNRGTVNKLQYDKQVEFWFRSDRSMMNASLPDRFYSRLSNIKRVFFEVFNESTTNPHIDYFVLLNHFTADIDPIVGFTNAIALGCGYPILTDMSIYEKSNLAAPHLYTSKTAKFQTLQNIINQRPVIENDINYARCSADINDFEDCPIPFSVVYHAFQYTQPMLVENDRMELSNAEILLEELETIFLELGSFDCEPIPYSRLMESSKLRKKIKETNFFSELDIYSYVQDLSQTSETGSLSQDPSHI